MSYELKPCPFCGADEASPYAGKPGPGVIKCWGVDCGAEISGFRTDKEAADHWNRRSRDAELAEAKAERDLLQDVLDSRPAINAGLPESYVRWSKAVYSGDVVRAFGGSL